MVLPIRARIEVPAANQATRQQPANALIYDHVLTRSPFA